MKDWAFITNHGLVLLYISKHNKCTIREIARAVGVTERTVHRSLADLEKEGYLSRVKAGGRNVYKIEHEFGLKHALTRDMPVGDLLHILNGQK